MHVHSCLLTEASIDTIDCLLISLIILPLRPSSPLLTTSALTTWEALQEALSLADRQLSKSQRQANHAAKRLRALESRDEQLQSLWASNKRMTWAARVIQRHYKAWRLRNLQFENLSDKQVS